jgi:heme A synthase
MWGKRRVPRAVRYRTLVPERAEPLSPFARCAWGLLAYDVVVVLWGAFVRATGSGAGCGRHWPTCNGDFVPRAPRIETLIEMSHRASSGVAFVLTAVLLGWGLRSYPRGHRVRRGAGAAMALMFGEAAIGAGLVLFELVAHDASRARAFSVSAHLVNTFLLLAAMALTAWWASGGAGPRSGQRLVAWVMGVPLSALLFVGATGAVTALGDTLFPSSSLAAGLREDFSPTAHLFIRLRGVHPVIAAMTGAATVIAVGLVRTLRPSPAVRSWSRATSVLVAAQVTAGIVSLLARAPVWMQLVHLLLADCLWIALVLTAGAALAEGEGSPSQVGGRPDRSSSAATAASPAS